VPRALALMAHPDDAELTCAGTLLLLKRAGWELHVATMTAGDLGSMTLPRARIARIRRAEAAASAKRLGAGYTCLGFGDLTVQYGVAAKRRVTALLRRVRPDLLFLHSPDCYMADHTESARLGREAAFASTIPNWKSGGGPPCASLPAVLYADPIDLVDVFGRRVPAERVVDITDVVEEKAALLAEHDSQRSWLREQHGEDEYLRWMRRMGADRARDLGGKGRRYAEGFRPHLGHGFPAEDLLTKALGRARVKTLKTKGGG
jgi:LmbE family N-acetylglucosaminyl deacetylase